jgi:hypothetical protein
MASCVLSWSLDVILMDKFKLKFPMLSAMSSTKHQPNPRKRPHSEVASEFPSIPSLSLGAAQEFAVKSQEAPPEHHRKSTLLNLAIEGQIFSID